MTKTLFSQKWSSLLIGAALLGAAAVGFTVFNADAHVIDNDCVSAGIGLDIRGEFQGTDDEAALAYDEHGPGGADTLDYKVTVSLTETQCPITDGEPELTLPDGTVIDLDDDLELASGGSQTYDVTGSPYVVAHANLGSLAGADADEVRARASVSANSHRASGLDQDVDASVNFDTLVLHPSTTVNISASDTEVQTGGTVTLTITEENDGDAPLTNPSVDVDNGVGSLDENSANFSGDNGNGILDPLEIWTWTVDVVVNGNTTYTATGHGTDLKGTDITFPADEQEQDSVEVTTVNPSTVVTIDSDSDVVQDGGTVLLTITETNDGDVDLTNPHVVLNPGAIVLDETHLDFDGTDNPDAGVLDPGEVWTWTIEVTVTGNSTYTATGHGTDTLGNDVTWTEGCELQDPEENILCDAQEEASVDVRVVNPSTAVTIESSAAEVLAGGTIDLTVTEENDGDVDLSAVSVVVNDGTSDIATLIAPPDAGDDGDGILEPTETWSWTIEDVVVSANTTFTATGHGTDSLGQDVTFCANGEQNVVCDADERDSVDVTTFNPSVTVDKNGDELSKVGDEVTYDFFISNTGDTNLYLDSVIDDVLGDLTTEAENAGCGQLGFGENCNFSVNYTVQGGDPDPLVNEVTVTYNTTSLLNGTEAQDTDDHSLNLFQPSVEVTKTGPAEGGTGDLITYSFTIENTGSSDSPDLNLESVTDDVIGDLTADATTAGCDVLAQGASCNFDVDYTIQGDDADPLVNTVSVLYHPEGFPNDITDTDDHSLDIQDEFAGCTPGYWRQEQHYGSWDGYTADQSFDDVFGTDITIKWSLKGKPGDVTVPTLLQALTANGGGVNALARHATAALLNAAALGDDYPYTEAEIIEIVQDAVDSGDFSVAGDFAEANEDSELGCTLGLAPTEDGFPEGALGETEEATVSEPVTTPAPNGKGPKNE